MHRIRPPLVDRTAELVEAARNGHAAAFGALYDLHIGAVRLAVRDHVRDPEHVADAAQEAFVRALEGISTLRRPDRFRPWLLAIARHAAVDIVREALQLDIVADHDVAPEASNGDPIDAVHAADLAELVHGCLSSISRRDATALELDRLGFSLAEMASTLEVSYGAAKVILHRARRRFRSMLVMQVLGKSSGCGEFRRLRQHRPAEQTHHVASCDACLRAARSEIWPEGGIVLRAAS